MDEPGVWETGDWAWDPNEDPKWDDPSIPRRRVPTDEYDDLANAIVRGACVAYAIIEDLRGLIERVQKHQDARFAKARGPDQDGFIRTIGVFNRDKREVDEPATRLHLRGCVLKHVNLLNLDIGCVLVAESRFDGDSNFMSARFGGASYFSNARFGSAALFADTRFGRDAWFQDTRFGGAANFGNARFGGDAQFERARFGMDAVFRVARFGGAAGFGAARFGGTTDFGDARFGEVAFFQSARFGGSVRYWRARCSGNLIFEDVSCSQCTLDNLVNDSSSFYDLDLRDRDMRDVGVRFPSVKRPWSWRVLKRELKRKINKIGWIAVRALGELSIISRVSVVALIVVPPIASVWPAVRAGIVGYNEAVGDISERFERSARALDEALGKAPDGPAFQAAETRARDAADRIEAWEARFGRMSVDDQDLPPTLALAFFAAAFVTLAQIIYQTRVPARIKSYSEYGFIEWMHQRYDEEAPDRADGLRRACDALAAIARIEPKRFENLIEHHGEMVWIPSKERIDWFEDLPPERVWMLRKERVVGASPEQESSGTGRDSTYPTGYVPGAERARIAIEEGARAEYELTARESRVASKFCFVFYFLAMVLLLIILWIQGHNVLHAAGLM